MSEVTLDIEAKNHFDGRMNNCYILGPSSILFYFIFHTDAGYDLATKIEAKQRELYLSEVSNRETKAVTEANNDTYCLQKRIEKFPLTTLHPGNDLAMKVTCQIIPWL